MGWFKTVKITANALVRQVKLDFHDLGILAVERIKHEDAFYCPDHTRAFEKQKLGHIYKMLRAERVTELANTHEPYEIKESMILYDELLRKKAKIIANNVFSTQIGDTALKQNQESDPVIETKERVLQRSYLAMGFVCRILMYGIIGSMLGLVGLKICCG